MSFNPVNFFSFATWLEHTKPDQPSQVLIRTIINRAYYAALISARNFTNTDTRQGHGRVIKALKDHDTSAGNKLHSLRELRQRADYHEGQPLTEREALRSLLESRHILFVLGVAPTSTRPYDADFLSSIKFIENH